MELSEYPERINMGVGTSKQKRRTRDHKRKWKGRRREEKRREEKRRKEKRISLPLYVVMS
jgi:hypothetical protein